MSELSPPPVTLTSLLGAGLPDSDALRALLGRQAPPFWDDLAELLTAGLAPELLRAAAQGEVPLLALPQSQLAPALAHRLHAPLALVQTHSAAGEAANARAAGAQQPWSFNAAEVRGRERAIIVSDQLRGGIRELELTLLLQRHECEVTHLLCAVEHTTAGGRHRLLQMGVQTVCAEQVAETPRGLVLERRRV